MDRSQPDPTQVVDEVIADVPAPGVVRLRVHRPELALHADVIVAGETARFGQPEIKLGIMPGAGGAQRLLRAIGNELITARDALAAGMVSEVVPDDRALPRALEIASTIAQMPQRAVRAIKDVVTLGLDAPLSVALAAERRAFQLLFDTPDQKEGMAAFLERRAPNFEHAS